MPSSSSTFGPQWPSHNFNIITLRRRDGLSLSLHRELVPLVSMLMDVTEFRGYNLVPGWCWGYAYRPISGTRTPSNHSRGCAIDINAPKNPYASASWHRRNGTRTIFGKRVRCDIPQAIFELWEAHGFYAGVRYGSKPDPMHFEFVRSVSECRAITARLRKLLKHPGGALPKPVPPKPPPEPEDDDMRHIVKGTDKQEWYLTDGLQKRHILTEAEAKVYAGAGASWKNGKPHVWPQPYLDRIPTL